jgi:hypothetical protein
MRAWRDTTSIYIYSTRRIRKKKVCLYFFDLLKKRKLKRKLRGLRSRRNNSKKLCLFTSQKIGKRLPNSSKPGQLPRCDLISKNTRRKNNDKKLPTKKLRNHDANYLYA